MGIIYNDKEINNFSSFLISILEMESDYFISKIINDYYYINCNFNVKKSEARKILKHIDNPNFKNLLVNIYLHKKLIKYIIMTDNYKFLKKNINVFSYRIIEDVINNEITNNEISSKYKELIKKIK